MDWFTMDFSIKFHFKSFIAPRIFIFFLSEGRPCSYFILHLMATNLNWFKCLEDRTQRLFCGVLLGLSGLRRFSHLSCNTGGHYPKGQRSRRRPFSISVLNPAVEFITSWVKELSPTVEVSVEKVMPCGVWLIFEWRHIFLVAVIVSLFVMKNIFKIIFKLELGL